MNAVLKACWLVSALALCAPLPRVWAQREQTPLLASGVLIKTLNPGFEDDYKPVSSASDAPNPKAVIQGAIADGWGDNSNWAEVDVEYGREQNNPHRGAATQRVTVNRVVSGAVQFVQQVPLRKGRIHVWKLWMRGRAGTSVTLSIRQAGAPYTEYASQNAALGAEWQEFRVFGAIPEDTDGFLMVRTTAPMTFWLDDSTLEDLTSASSDTPPRLGNLIPGGGTFEAGLPYGWSVRYQGEQGFQPSDPRPKIDGTTAAVGQKSLCCEMPVGSSVRVASPLLHFNFGRAHTVSFWAKARVARTQLNANLEKGFGGNFALDTQWKRYSFSGTLPFLPYTQLHFNVPQTTTHNTVWIDGVQLEEKAEADAEKNYISPEARVLSLTMPQPGHVLVANEKGNVRFTTAVEYARPTQLKLWATDLAGRRTNLKPISLTAKSAGYFPLPSFGNRYGTWKLSAQITEKEGTPVSALAELVWARVPHPKTIEPSRSYFGAHVPLTQNYFDIARRIGVRRTRLHDTSMVGKWNTVEPEKGRYHYYDQGIDMAKRSGISVLGMLDGAPRWTTTQPREGYWGFWNIPDRLGALERWDNYVSRTVGHFRGRIDQWEIWNEPWGSWWSASGNPNATPQLYGELSRRAYLAAKQANPNVSILGVDSYPGSTWTNAVLSHVGPKHFDGFSYHEYNDAPFGGPEAIPFLRRKEFISAQAKYGTPKPLWNTEGGLFGVGSWLAPETGGMPVAQQPAYIVRFDVTQMAAGIRAFYLYSMVTDPALGDISTATTEYDRSVKPILSARAVLASLVDGLGTPKRSEPVKGVDFYTYPGAKVSVLWSYDGKPHSVTVPRGSKALDVWGNALHSSQAISVGDEPVYFVR